MLSIITQIGIVFFSGSAQFAYARKNRFGPVFSVLGQPCWIYSAITARQWGNLATCFMFTAFGLLGLWNWWFKPGNTGPVVDELAELRAENARLRLLLEPVAA